MSDEKSKAKVSNAPPPINPIRGSWSAPRRPSVPPPEWPKWLILGKVEGWEAAALSLNLEPGSVNQYDGGTFPSDDIFRDFEWRIRAVVSNELGGVLSRSDKLSLPVFAAWAVSKGINIPGELRPHGADAAFGFPAQIGASEKYPPSSSTAAQSLAPADCLGVNANQAGSDTTGLVAWQGAILESWDKSRLSMDTRPQLGMCCGGVGQTQAPATCLAASSL
jgi:hypothetical protein